MLLPPCPSASLPITTGHLLDKSKAMLPALRPAMGASGPNQICSRCLDLHSRLPLALMQAAIQATCSQGSCIYATLPQVIIRASPGGCRAPWRLHLCGTSCRSPFSSALCRWRALRTHAAHGRTHLLQSIACQEHGLSFLLKYPTEPESTRHKGEHARMHACVPAVVNQRYDALCLRVMS